MLLQGRRSGGSSVHKEERSLREVLLLNFLRNEEDVEEGVLVRCELTGSAQQTLLKTKKRKFDIQPLPASNGHPVKTHQILNEDQTQRAEPF